MPFTAPPPQGVRTGDVILEFGSVTEVTFKGLQDIGAVVQHSSGVSLKSHPTKMRRETWSE